MMRLPPERRERALIEGRLEAARNAVEMDCPDNALLLLDEARELLMKVKERLEAEEHGDNNGSEEG
jgi:hypothetical protein